MDWGGHLVISFMTLIIFIHESVAKSDKVIPVVGNEKKCGLVSGKFVGGMTHELHTLSSQEKLYMARLRCLNVKFEKTTNIHRPQSTWTRMLSTFIPFRILNL